MIDGEVALSNCGAVERRPQAGGVRTIETANTSSI